MSRDTFSQIESDLIQFVLHYPALDRTFSTSWTNNATCPTPEEEIVTRFLTEKGELDEFAGWKVGWPMTVARFLIDTGPLYFDYKFDFDDEEANADYEAFAEACVQFMTDVMSDYVSCNMSL